MYNRVVGRSYTLQSVPPIFPVPTGTVHNYYILLTLLPMLYFTSLWLSCDYQWVLLNLFTFPPSPPTLLPSGNHQSVLCICESVSVYKGYFKPEFSLGQVTSWLILLIFLYIEIWKSMQIFNESVILQHNTALIISGTLATILLVLFYSHQPFRPSWIASWDLAFFYIL